MYVLHPANCRPCSRKIRGTLELEMHAISIGGSNLIGALSRRELRGMAVADIATESDIDCSPPSEMLS